MSVDSRSLLSGQLSLLLPSYLIFPSFHPPSSLLLLLIHPPLSHQPSSLSFTLLPSSLSSLSSTLLLPPSHLPSSLSSTLLPLIHPPPSHLPSSLSFTLLLLILPPPSHLPSYIYWRGRAVFWIPSLYSIVLSSTSHRRYGCSGSWRPVQRFAYKDCLSVYVTIATVGLYLYSLFVLEFTCTSSLPYLPYTLVRILVIHTLPAKGYLLVIHPSLPSPHHFLLLSPPPPPPHHVHSLHLTGRSFRGGSV